MTPATTNGSTVTAGSVMVSADVPDIAASRSAPVLDSRAACPVLRAEGVTKSYRRGLWPRRRVLPVLRGADLELCAGEVVGLVGENGSGKSTLMKILVGALDADAGTVWAVDRVGYCPQEPLLYDRLTCDEHLELFGVAYEMDPAAVVAASEALYASLGFARWRNARVEELSGGTRAKLNLALALLSDPDVLLLDEPYAGFDWDTYLRFWELTAERRAAGRSVLVVSHFVTDHERFDRLVELRAGKTVSP
ncbi:MAG: ATP-binding cassette domain-containing protein [Acidimicrobiales bacterium]